MRSFGLNFGLVRLGKRLFCSRTRRRVWRLMVGKLNFINHSVYASFELIFAIVACKLVWDVAMLWREYFRQRAAAIR